MDFDEYMYYMRDDLAEEDEPEFPFPSPEATFFTLMDEKDIRRRTLKDGSYQIWCRKGLWKVVSPNRALAEIQARHYWRQYKQDGEYDRIDASQVCDDCGSLHGTYVAGESTWHVGTCDVCHQEKPVTEARDYNYLRKTVSK
jgi:hypothetical protein